MPVFDSYPLISPFLWFNTDAEAAVDFYVGIFPNSSKLETITPPGFPRPITIAFELDGLKFTALNGGPGHAFTDATSWVVRCDTQDQIDFYWQRLTDGGTAVQCGWLKDRFGISWQVIPTRLPELIRSPAAMNAMMSMKKIVLAELEQAAQA